MDHIGERDWAWTIALAVAGGFTVSTLFSTLYRVLFVPALDLSGREGWAIFRGNDPPARTA